MDADDAAERLRSVRRAKRVALVALLLGVAGAVTLGLARAEQAPPPEPTEFEPALPGAPSIDVARPPSMPPPAPRWEAKGPTRRVPVRVLLEGAPARGVTLRAMRHDAAASTAVDLSAPVRTDGEGLAVLVVEEPVAPDAFIEMAYADDTGARHGFAPLLEAASAGAGPASVVLPAGGSLKIEVRGLPENVRVKRARVQLQAPYGDFLRLFADARGVAAADGGPTERGAVPPSFKVAIDEAGNGTLAHVPDTFAVAVSVEGVPDGFVVEEVRCSAPTVPSSEGSVLRVPEGAACTYTLHWKALPSAKVRVVDEAGAAIAGARVAVGVVVKGTGTRVSPEVVTTDADGRASVFLWSGTHLPAWTPDGYVVVTSARGRRSRVDVLPGARWYGVETTVALAPSAGGSFRVAGTLRFPTGGVAAGVPVALAGREPWNGHRAIAPFEAVTDPQGEWSFEVPEDLRAVFAHGGGVRLHVDGDRLENGPEDALWRSRWRTLPRATTDPPWIELPPPGETSRADLTLVLP